MVLLENGLEAKDKSEMLAELKEGNGCTLGIGNGFLCRASAAGFYDSEGRKKDVEKR